MNIALLAGLLAAAGPMGDGGGRVSGSKHDFSITGPGDYRATSERNPCAFCHVPHGGAKGLSNRPDPSQRYQRYESGRVKGDARGPTGASRICLSCHDGTIAVGRTRTKDIQMVGGNRPIDAAHRSRLGTDLRGTHPISLRPGAGASVHPPKGDAVKLDRAGEVQCTSCHDPHAEWGDPEIGMFLVKPEAGLCTTCHTTTAGSRQSGHFSSNATQLSADGKRTRSVGANPCANCHVSHHAPPGSTLDHEGPTNDSTCLGCHDGKVARLSIANDVAKPSAHRSAGRGVHGDDEKEESSSKRLPETSVARPRHVACVDCHAPHSSTEAKAVAPAVQGVLTGQWGIAIDGQRVDSVRFEYEVCLKCHGDSANKPATSALSGVRRQVADSNLRRVFDPSAASFHPVAAPGRNANVPGLIPPLSSGSMIYCTDCHASDSSTSAGGAGARGPHGSIYPFMLERQYLVADGTLESPQSYALCYKCHARDVLLSSQSPFPHAKHVVGTPLNPPTPCSACHSAHGVSSLAGNSMEHAHLVSFDLNIVKETPGTPLRYRTEGPGRGSCNLTCHGRVHDDRNGRYPAAPTATSN
jgi:predicted CXXCH cytochrome family protein